MGTAPEGLCYVEDFLTPDEHATLLRDLQQFDYEHDIFRGQRLKRGYAQFGYAYVSNGRKLERTLEMPPCLTMSIEKAKAHCSPCDPFNQCIVTHYPPNSGIGWHTDAPRFGECIVGVSLGGAARFQFRRNGTEDVSYEIKAAPGSMYLMRGPARWEHQHQVVPVKAERYSLTFRHVGEETWMRPLRLVYLSSLAMLGALAGCEEGKMTAQPIEFPFEHPACEKVRQIFLTLPVYSEEDYRRLALRDRYLWDVRWFEAEVMNGGVDQYLSNSTGDHFAECLEALQAIGADGAYQFLRRACDLFPNGRPSATRETRQQQIETILAPRGLDDLLDDRIEGSIETDLYQRMLDFYYREENRAAKSE